jgi:hypothetical protein
VLAKCANPKCSADFRHLSNGKLFRVPRVGTKIFPMEHFWLCSKCAETMTLGIDRDQKVNVVSVLAVRGAAAS